MGKKNKNSAEEFPHFRRYNKSGHPALITDEFDDYYKFRRVTSSEFSGHHRNEKVDPNPDKRRDTPMYIVKQRQRDKKNSLVKSSTLGNIQINKKTVATSRITRSRSSNY